MKGPRLGAILLLAGCAGGPLRDFVPPPLPTPLAEAEPPEVRPIAKQWYPVDARSVGLLAGDRSLDAVSGRLDLEAARIMEDQARRALWPSLRPQVRFFSLDGLTQATEGAFVQVDKQNLTLGAGAVLSLDVVEARARALAARQRRRAAEQASDTARRTTMLAAEEQFDDLVRAQNELAITRELLAGARSVAEFERARERGGAGLAADRLRAEAAEAEATGDIVRAEAAFRDASARLAETLRIDPRVTLYAAEPAVEVVQRIPRDAELENLIQEALSTRPEIAESLLLVEAAEREWRGARLAPFVPGVEVNAGFNAFGENFGHLTDQEVTSLGLVWDLSPQRFGRRHGARTKLDRERLSLARRREAVLGAVVRNYELARVSPEAIESARRRTEASVEAVRVVQRRREAGAALVVEVLDAQRQVALARRELLRAILAHNRAQRRLMYAVGR
ncbi:MAG: TolC family protein [Planctomycetota bacterium]